MYAKTNGGYRPVLLAALAFAALLFLAPEARACSCMFGGSAPCQDYWKTDAVFVGTVIGSSKVKSKEGSFDFQRRLVRMTVETPLKGIEGASAEVITGWGGGDCGYQFESGKSYIVYAQRDEKDGRLYTSICTRTAPLEEADEDLAFVRGLSSASPTGLVFGRVVRRNYEWKEGDFTFKPVEGAELSVEGAGGSREVKTDAEGKFRAEGLAPGEYKLTLKIPKGLTYNGGAEDDRRTVGGKVEVAARGCARREFYLESDSRVAGRVVDAAGQPVANLQLEMRGAPADTRNINTFLHSRTGADGGFEFKAVPPGQYLLGFRIMRGPYQDSPPYPRTYYPGVQSKHAAEAVTVKEGEHLRGLELRMPEARLVLKVSGFVTWADGRPAPGASIYITLYEEGEQSNSVSAKADERGRFSVALYEGMTYKVSAYLRPSPESEGAQSTQVQFTVEPGLQVIGLTLPLPKR